MATYAFSTIVAAINGPGGAFSIGSDAGCAEEGITVDMVDEKSTMVIGAGGQGQHNLHAGKAAKITVRLLKTSPTNALLEEMYNLQTATPALHGQNTITIRDVYRGDVGTAQEVAFAKFPTVTYSKDGPVLEWMFNAITMDWTLGGGLPVAL